jgi:glucose-1-phosphate thymidylyltransferase
VRGILLAAGYATRLHPLTIDRPKALLPVGNRTILDRLVDALEHAGIDEVRLVTNRRFAPAFEEWRAGGARKRHVRISDDGTQTNETRLGAVADLALAIEESGIDQAALVAAADNIFAFDLGRFVEFFSRIQTDCITAHHETDHARLSRTGVVELDGAGRVTGFSEKPLQPRSTWACPPLYILERGTLPLVAEYLGDPTHDRDAPGHFIRWLVERRPVHAFRFEGQRYAIGDLESYERVCRLFSASEARSQEPGASK